MMRTFWFLLIFVFTACQSQQQLTNYIILDRQKTIKLQTQARSLEGILTEAGIQFSSPDKVQYNGVILPDDFVLPSGGPYVLEILRAHTLTLITPTGETSFKTTAANVGQALTQTGLALFAADFVAPALETPIDTDLTIHYRPAQDVIIHSDGKISQGKSSALTVGQALAAVGITLQGLDRSLPEEDQPLPTSGKIEVIRVTETVDLLEKTIPFTQKVEYSTDLADGSQQVLQAGEPGLIVSRVRVRLENGVEVARTTEAETIVRQPQQRLVLQGSKANILSLDIPGGQIEYWRAVPMYATAYSPCRSGSSKCYYGTASGLPVKHGVVAVTRDLYNQLSGSRVYIPGYGIAVIADVGGGFPDGRLWIDLGYSDNDYQNWSGIVTVYFLAPVPANIPAVLE